MTRIEFTAEEIMALENERFHHPVPMIQRRMEAVYLKSQGLQHKDIQKICRISKTSLTTYLKQYQSSGIEGIKTLRYIGAKSELDTHKITLEAYFKDHPPRTTAEAQQIIKDLTGIERCPTQVQKFMKRLGMKCRKVGYVPGKAANPIKHAEQETFKIEMMNPRLAEAKEGKRAVLFMDAAHFVHGAYLALVWCFCRIFITSPSGRKRYNVLGVVDAITKNIITFTNETYINAESVCCLLTQIAEYYGKMPVTIILDNASYQRCSLVLEHAKSLNIELLFLPSYSPHLNLIERFWRYVRKECLYSKYYSKFEGFKQAISDCIQSANMEDKHKLETLLTLNFQSFEKAKIHTV